MRSFRLLMLASLSAGILFGSIPCHAQESVSHFSDDDGPEMHAYNFTEGGANYVLSSKDHIVAAYYVGVTRGILRSCADVPTIRFMPVHPSAKLVAEADKQLADAKFACVQQKVDEARQEHDLPADAILIRK